MLLGGTPHTRSVQNLQTTDTWLAFGLGRALLLSSFIGCKAPLSTGPCSTSHPLLYQFIPVLHDGNTELRSHGLPLDLSFHGEMVNHTDRWGQALCWKIPATQGNPKSPLALVEGFKFSKRISLCESS